MIQETGRRLDYAGADQRLFYWRTNNGAEVDLIIERAGRPVRAIEFKSRPTIDGADIRGLRSFHEDNPGVPFQIVCTASEPWKLDFVEVVPWQEYLTSIP